MITDAMQCRTCYHYETLGHTYCTCGLANPAASGEVKERVSQNFMKCSKMLTTSAFVFLKLYYKARDHLKSVKKKGSNCILGRYLEYE